LKTVCAAQISAAKRFSRNFLNYEYMNKTSVTFIDIRVSFKSLLTIRVQE